MEYKNILQVKSRKEFRKWLQENCSVEKECYVSVARGKPDNDAMFWYIDAVEEALCYGWIDSTIRMINGVSMQRFSPRRKNSNWTELNKERVRRLEKLGLMTNEGRKTLPDMDKPFEFDKDVEKDLRDAEIFEKFQSFHPLYQRVRASNLHFYKKHHPESYNRMLNHVIDETKKGKMFGSWNDFGRLIDY